MLTELKTLVAVARCGTFAAAGGKIGLTQSAVSSQIKRLEEALGLALFDRTGRSATLNAAGLRVVDQAEELIARFSRLGDPADNDTSDVVLQLGALSSLQPSLVARALVDFRQTHPHQPVRVVPGPSLYLLNQIDLAAMDLAVMIRPPFGLMPDMRWYPLVREPFRLAVAQSVKGADWRSLLQSRPFLRLDRSTFGGRQVDRFLKSRNLVVRESIEMDEIPAMASLVAADAGVSLFPVTEAYMPYLSDVRLISLGEDTFYREIGLLSRKAASADAAVDCLIGCLEAAAGIPRAASPRPRPGPRRPAAPKRPGR